jgi:hypothetical protein
MTEEERQAAIQETLAKIEAAAALARSIQFHEIHQGFVGLANGMVELAKLLAKSA